MKQLCQNMAIVKNLSVELEDKFSESLSNLQGLVQYCYFLLVTYLL